MVFGFWLRKGLFPTAFLQAGRGDLIRKKRGVWLLGVLLVLSGCVTPQYVDWKILQTKTEKLEERLSNVENLSVTTEARVSELTAALQETRKALRDMERSFTQQFREERAREAAAMQAQFAALQQEVAEISRRMRDLIEVGVIRKLILQGTVYFGPKQTELSPEAREVLNKLGAELIVRNFFSIEISGYADQEGSAAKIFALSQKRAEVVADYLIKHFSLDRHKISIAGFGDAYPLAPGTTEEGRAKNRRVEVKAFSLSLP